MPRSRVPARARQNYSWSVRFSVVVRQYVDSLRLGIPALPMLMVLDSSGRAAIGAVAMVLAGSRLDRVQQPGRFLVAMHRPSSLGSHVSFTAFAR